MQPAPGCVVARAVAHLPAVKQRQLCAITRIIRSTADVERVVLFGSHARGD
jgi:predicted nucleotidyltransferase